jgi:hypothetical protein
MINLSVCDKIDGLGKIDELRSVVGKYHQDGDIVELISVSEDGDRCIVLKRDYTNRCEPYKVSEPSWLTWNRMFF